MMKKILGVLVILLWSSVCFGAAGDLVIDSKVDAWTFGSNITVGLGTAATDYTVTFDGEDSDGVITWLEDEGYFTGSFNVFNVMAYGATGDGVADDTAEIQAAIDAAEADGGGEVYFPAGTYEVSAQLTINDERVSLVGDQTNASKIERASGFDTGDTVEFTGVNYGTIRDLSFLSTTRMTQDAHVHLNQCPSRIYIERCYMLNGNIGVLMTGYSVLYISHTVMLTGSLYREDTWLVGTTYAINDLVYLEGRTYKSLQNANTGNSPDTTRPVEATAWWEQASPAKNADASLKCIATGDADSNAVHIDHCNFARTAGGMMDYGIYITAMDGMWMNDTHVGGCNLEAIHFEPDAADGGEGDNTLTGVRIDNSHFEIKGEESATESISFTGNTTSGYGLTSISDCFFQGHGATGMPHRAIYINSSDLNNVAINNNEIIWHYQEGIKVDAIEGGLNITGNQISSCSLDGAGSYSGIYIADAVNDFNITDNIIGNLFGSDATGNTDYGIEIAGTTHDDYVVMGNNLTNNQEAVGLFDAGTSDNKLVAGNLPGTNDEGFIILGTPPMLTLDRPIAGVPGTDQWQIYQDGSNDLYIDGIGSADDIYLNPPGDDVRVTGGSNLVVDGNATLGGDLAVNGDNITSDGTLTITPATTNNVIVATDSFEVKSDSGTAETVNLVIDQDHADDDKDPLLEWRHDGVRVWRIHPDLDGATIYDDGLRFADAGNAVTMWLTQAGNVLMTGDLNVTGDITAASYADNSPIYVGGDALGQLAAMLPEQGVAVDGWAKVDHSSLPEGVKVNRKRAKKDDKGKEVKDANGKTIMEDVGGRDLGKLLCIAVKAITELQARIEILEAR